jgi:hypothetical protein
VNDEKETETNLFELAREDVDDAFFLCLVGIDEVLLTLATAATASARESPNGRGEGHDEERQRGDGRATNELI